MSNKVCLDLAVIASSGVPAVGPALSPTVSSVELDHRLLGQVDGNRPMRGSASGTSAPIVGRSDIGAKRACGRLPLASPVRVPCPRSPPRESASYASIKVLASRREIGAVTSLSPPLE